MDENKRSEGVSFVALKGRNKNSSGRKWYAFAVSGVELPLL